MRNSRSNKFFSLFLAISILFTLFASPAGEALAAPAVPVSFTILHTNDFHGQLVASGSNPGSAKMTTVINGIRTAKGAANVLLVDSGDEMQGSLLSNLGDGTATGKGLPTIAVYNAMGYNVATFGNHEFDWGQVNLANRTTEATYPYVTANIVQKDGADCASSGWTPPTFADAPYQIFTMGTEPNTVKVAFIGVTTTETPTITVSTATAGLCFKDPAEAIIHHYAAMKAAGADVIVVLSHLGNSDGGYGYGIPVYGDVTLAKTLNTAGKPVNLIIGGHSHSNLSSATTEGSTKIVQAYYNGRTIGQADVTVGTDGSVSITWSRKTGADITGAAADASVATLINDYATNPAYLAIVNQPIGYSAVDLSRGSSGNNDNMMGAFIDDAIYNYLNTDAEASNDVDLFFNNAGGIRADWCYVLGVWTSTGCVSGTHAPGLLTYGNMFSVLPFGNATVVGTMSGAKILEVLNYGPNVAGVIQPAGLKYNYFKYTDALTGPYAWGAFDITIYNKDTDAYEPLDLTKNYRVGTNEFLAPAGGDGYSAFKYMTNISYWGDMLNAVNAFVTANYGTEETAYAGPNGDGTLDGRIGMNGDGDTVFEGGSEIIPLTILHHNDSHGNMYKGTYVGYTQLATLIKQERGRNPTRTLLLSSGDNIQGDGMMFYFKTAPTGFASDGTPLAAELQMNPLIKAFNSMSYDAMTLGNHEFNFGKDVFTSVLGQATFPLLQANISDDSSYGLAAANIEPYVEKTVGAEGIDVAIIGIGNHRVPNYELPSNIPGLTFSDPIAKAQELATLLDPANDVVIALTHIGFTENPASVEVDANVDSNLAMTTNGIDAIIGGHSHTNPASGFGSYKYLPSIVANTDGEPVLINQAYRYNNTLGVVSIGLRSNGGGYEVVSKTGRYLSVATATAEDAATKAIVDPYLAVFNTYNNTTIGSTTAPIDALQAFTQETNGANLQADAAIYELSDKHGIPVDFHLSGAMTNKKIADSATPGSPYSLKISDMFTAMPYENSLVVLRMNGPQLKTVLERAYRNYYYYKYVTGYGGYSYYTTCMLDTNFGNKITYNDLYPALPNGKNVVSLKIGSSLVNFNDASTYYRVSTVNYLAAGSCNFNDSGVSLWPLDQIVADTQYYVRDSVIDYVTHMGTVSPAIEGRLSFITDTTAPEITITFPTATSYINTGSLILNFSATDDISGIRSVKGDIDGVTFNNGAVVNLWKYGAGPHTLTVTAEDMAYNVSTKSVTFTVTSTFQSLISVVKTMYNKRQITSYTTYQELLKKLNEVYALSSWNKEAYRLGKISILNSFITKVNAASGHFIVPASANVLMQDARYMIQLLSK